MDKPATMAVREFKEKIVTAINESGLPAFALIPVIEGALGELNRIDEQQYQTDKKAYEEASKEDVSE